MRRGCGCEGRALPEGRGKQQGWGGGHLKFSRGSQLHQEEELKFLKAQEKP